MRVPPWRLRVVPNFSPDTKACGANVEIGTSAKSGTSSCDNFHTGSMLAREKQYAGCEEKVFWRRMGCKRNTGLSRQAIKGQGPSDRFCDCFASVGIVAPSGLRPKCTTREVVS